ncbi:DUF3336 domain-containing protein [Pseudomaricurvus alkylphenolicus]|jgi:NTE family protein|uniref:DUF3336 domain-containing protein n=1 Tax=Pseudomaricurvus alkylphenolicus TaxID=1306991 RepID=UPI00142102EE|nr:DUF3336 domain-containing protein [Pseudomaricurvus alkylphenolicus]NIB40628.1 DUF3336 domain-containing protein [Pseudomaricurvus alkylphenolicus]
MFSTKLHKPEIAMRQASCYEEWQQAAIAHDAASGNQRWKRMDQSKHFDYRSIRLRLDQLRQLRARQDYPGLLFVLNEGIHGNVDGMGSPLLYQRAKFGTKQLIEDYVSEITESLELLAGQDHDNIGREEKLDFFHRAQHCFGRSALMFSGSGMLAYFHIGVAKALWQQQLLPDILSGSSGGSIIGSILATHSDEELQRVFSAENLVYELDATKSHKGILRRLGPKLMQVDDIRSMIERLVPDMTFQEAWEKTGRWMNISIAPAETHQTSRLLNAITTPNVLMREGILASCALPGVYPSVTLMAKDKHGEKKQYLPSRRWVDGAISDDLPAKRLARLYGVNHYIASQTNPYVIPFISDSKRSRRSSAAIKRAAYKTAKEWLNASATVVHRPLARHPRVSRVTNTALAILNQNYIGDINLLPPFRFRNPGRLLAALSREEIHDLIDMGERSAWPKIEMIRVQTRISRTLNRIVRDYEQTGHSEPTDNDLTYSQEA